jgi:hypothetical protein
MPAEPSVALAAISFRKLLLNPSFFKEFTFPNSSEYLHFNSISIISRAYSIP